MAPEPSQNVGRRGPAQGLFDLALGKPDLARVSILLGTREAEPFLEFGQQSLQF
jgi:hypothetical protein